MDDTSSSTLTTLKRYINDVYRDVNRRMPWPFTEARDTFNLTDGGRTIDVSVASPTIFKIRSVAAKMSTGSNEQFRLLQPITREEYEALEDEITEGTPRFWSYEDGNDTLVLAPIPSYTLTDGLRVRYSKNIDDLSASSDTPVWPAEYHHVLVDGAAWKWFDQEDDLRAGQYRGYFENGVRRMINELMNRHDQGVPRVGFSEG